MPVSTVRVVHVVPTIGRNYGGPAQSVPALCESLAAVGASVELLASDVGETFGPLVLPNPRAVHTTLVPSFFNRKLRVLWSPLAERAIYRTARGRVVHAHGIWLPIAHQAARAARRLGSPLVVSPRGMLEDWALSQKALKKRFAWRVYQRDDLAAAAALHATSEEEALSIRRSGLRQPIALIPNGVVIEASGHARPHRASSERIALFLSRIHPKKRPLDLVRAWNVVRPPGWRLLLVGPDEDNHRAEVADAIRTLGLEGVVELRDAVDRAGAEALYALADLFVLPTHSENFGMVVAEALAAGLPVITTHGAPWKIIADEQCGWWIPTTLDALVAALRTATSASDSERAEMGARGRTIIAERYSWSGAAVKMCELYEWLSGLSPRPRWVIAD